MNKKTIINIKCTFYGLYQWGSGWNISSYLQWKDFWSKHKGIYWHYVRFPQDNNTEYLVGLHGSIYLHPMDFNACIVDRFNGNMEGVVSELKKTCEECASYCGGSCLFEVSEVKSIDMGNLTALD